MPTATDVLRKEHDAILRMLDVAEALAVRLREGTKVPPAHLHDIHDFLTTFADRCHHGKEEDLLFPKLEERGIPREGGPVGVMLHEHTLGRKLIGEMKRSAEAYAKGNVKAGASWASAAADYAELLRQHIRKENEVLFVMAESVLSDAEQASLVRDFDRVEVEKLGAGTHERLHALMDRLSAEVLKD